MDIPDIFAKSKLESVCGLVENPTKTPGSALIKGTNSTLVIDVVLTDICPIGFPLTLETSNDAPCPSVSVLLKTSLLVTL